MWQASRRFLTVHSYPRHLRTRECPYHPFSIVIAHGTQKCVKSSQVNTDTNCPTRFLSAISAEEIAYHLISLFTICAEIRISPNPPKG